MINEVNSTIVSTRGIVAECLELLSDLDASLSRANGVIDPHWLQSKQAANRMMGDHYKSLALKAREKTKRVVGK